MQLELSLYLNLCTVLDKIYLYMIKNDIKNKFGIENSPKYYLFQSWNLDLPKYSRLDQFFRSIGGSVTGYYVKLPWKSKAANLTILQVLIYLFWLEINVLKVIVWIWIWNWCLNLTTEISSFIVLTTLLALFEI